jgi:hypothetical protein
MRRFTAQYIITNSGPPLKRAVLTTEDDGTILSVEDTQGDLKERHSTEFYNGVIIPGFINCHCHLELSHMKNSAAENEGLVGFIEQIRSTDITVKRIYTHLCRPQTDKCMIMELSYVLMFATLPIPLILKGKAESIISTSLRFLVLILKKQLKDLMI